MKALKTLALVIFIVALTSGSHVEPEQANIVLLFIDDWAWNGTPIQMDEPEPPKPNHHEGVPQCCADAGERDILGGIKKDSPDNA